MRLVTEGTYSYGCGPEPVSDPEPPRSLRLSLLAAARHMELGEYQAGITAFCDAQWISHRGDHELVSDLDMVLALRRIGGFGWAPPEDRA